MYTNFNFSQTLRKGMAFLLLPLLAVMSISLANSAPPANNSVEITFPNLVHLSDHSLARKGEVLALGTECANMVNSLELKEIKSLKEIEMSWMQPEMTLHLYRITGNTPIEDMVQYINQNKADFDCIVSPNYLTYLSGHSMWGSPHDGYGANAKIPDIQGQNAISIVNPSTSVMGSGVTVAMFDSYCQGSQGQGTSQHHLQNRGFDSIDYQGDYTTHVAAQFGLSGSPPNLCGHGEGVASILRTIAPNTDILLYRVLGNNGFGTLDGLLKAINNLARMGPPAKYVMNLSLGVMGDSLILEKVLEEVNQQGTVIVAAAGNNGRGKETQYPAAYPSVIAVAASNNSGNSASYANSGDVLAPGGEGNCKSQLHDCLTVLNLRAGSGAAYWKGSSFSTGLVSGLAALLLEIGPTLNPTGVKAFIQQGTTEEVLDINNSLNLCLDSGPCQ